MKTPIIIFVTINVFLTGCLNHYEKQNAASYGRFNELLQQANKVPFESDKWRNDRSSRSKMVGTLRFSNRLQKLSALQVRELLGDPDSVSGENYIYDIPNTNEKLVERLEVHFKNEVVAETTTNIHFK